MSIFTYTHTEGEDTLNGRVGPGSSESLARNCHTNSIHGGWHAQPLKHWFDTAFPVQVKNPVRFFPDNYNLDHH
jgi:hypothetical protein